MCIDVPLLDNMILWGCTIPTIWSLLWIVIILILAIVKWLWLVLRFLFSGSYRAGVMASWKSGYSQLNMQNARATSVNLLKSAAMFFAALVFCAVVVGSALQQPQHCIYLAVWQNALLVLGNIAIIWGILRLILREWRNPDNRWYGKLFFALTMIMWAMIPLVSVVVLIYVILQ